MEEQRLVLRGKLLEDDVDVSSIDGRIFLARRTTGRRGETEEVQLTVKMVDGVSHPGIRINSSLDRLARDFQQEVLLQMNLPLELGYKFVTKGRLISESETLRDLELADGDTVVVVPPRANPPRAANAAKRITGLFKGLWQWLLLLFRFLWLLPRIVLAYLLDAWYDPWSLVRPRATGNETPGRRIRGVGITPQMVRYAPGQNPRGEDLTALLSQGLLGM